MTLKDLLLRGVLSAIFAACLIFVHFTIKQNVSNITEKLFAKPYTSLSDEDAHELGASTYEGLVEDTNRRLEEWQECVARTEGHLERIVCRERPTAVKAAGKSSLIADGHRIHREEFVSSEVKPHIDSTETIIEWVFDIAYAIIGLFVLLIFLKWFVFKIQPLAGRVFGKMCAATRLSQNLKDIYANRKLRQAEKDFLTVKNLYDNGLITEEMFLKRKDDLMAVLGGNGIFRDENDTASPK